MPEANLVVVQAFNKEWESEMAKGALKAAGIDAMIRADSVGGTRPHVAWAGGGFKVLVREGTPLWRTMCWTGPRSPRKRALRCAMPMV